MIELRRQLGLKTCSVVHKARFVDILLQVAKEAGVDVD